MPTQTSRLRIAMLGSRGVPATFGGVERSVEELGAGLAGLGHDVTVFCRPRYVEGRPASYRGMRLRYGPAINTKNLEAASHTLVATMAALRGFDVLHYHAIGPGIFTPIPRALSRAAVVQTVQGLDSHRAKWGPIARRALETGEWISRRVPDRVIVVSEDLLAHYRSHGAQRVELISNGVDPIPQTPPGDVLRRHGLEAGEYLLFLGRLVPEKAPDLLVRAFRRLGGSTRLVIAGGSSHTDDYVAGLRELARGDDRVIFTGYVYGAERAELFSNATAFVLPSSLEGFPIALLEALSCGLPVVVSDIPPNVEALAGSPAGIAVRAGDEAALAAGLDLMLAEASLRRQAAAELGRRVVARYSWAAVTNATEAVYRRALAARR